VHSFRSALKEGLRLAESADAAKYGFKPGDAEHLRRWIGARRPTAPFDELAKGKTVTQKRIIDFIRLVLAARQIAETTDGLNATFAKLERTKPRLAKKERRNALVQFADGKVSQEALDAYLAGIDLVVSVSVSNLDPLFVVRSDKNGGRKRTIFCRILSDTLRHNGRWYDPQIAALCNIAFGCDDVTDEAVRAARKGLLP
jgi:hypothetical protein